MFGNAKVSVDMIRLWLAIVFHFGRAQEGQTYEPKFSKILRTAGRYKDGGLIQKVGSAK